MLRLTVSLSLVAALGVVSGGICAPPAVVAAPDQVDSPIVDWDKRWDKTMKDAAAEYAKIWKKYSEKLEATAAYTRRRVLRYTPDDEETRKFLGYVKAKQSDGTEKWERYDVRAAQINEMSDLDDPKQTKYSKDLTEADKKVAGWFKGLAKKAAEYGAAKDATPDGKWAEKAARGWERVLEVDDNNDEAHKALAHPKFEGKYCSQFKFKFMQIRATRKKSGEKTNASAIKEVTPCDVDGTMATAGLAGGGAKSAHMLINTSHGKDAAVKFASYCEKALNDLVEIYGYPETIKERMPCSKMTVVKDVEEWKQALGKAWNWKGAEIQRYIDAGFGGSGVRNGEYLRHGSAGVDSDDFCMNATSMYATVAAQGAARTDLGSSVREGVEDWLSHSIGYDVTKRVLGTAYTIWGAFGRYGQSVEPKPGVDVWIELARRLVEADDDVPLQKLPKLKDENQDFKGPQTVKGYAFIQFLFEKDSEKAKKFVWNALANGTPTAVATIYPNDPDTPDPEKSMELLDAEYREWITKAW